MVSNKSKKGFTLIEMVIAMVVIVIVFGMVTLMSVSISAFSQEKTLITTCHEEAGRAQQFINNWSKSLDDAFNTNFSLVPNGIAVKSGIYWFTDDDHSFNLRYDPATKTISGDFYINGKMVHKEETFTQLTNVSFYQGSELISNTVKCVLSMADGSDYTMLLQKESSKPGMNVIFSQPFEKTAGSYNEFIFITSADWDPALNTTEYTNLEELDRLSSFSSAYQYAALSMLRVQVDHQNRMSLEAFTSAYGGKWQVRIFSASGKVAYGMKLLNSDFAASSRRLSFFIEEGSILFDGTPVEPMGYTRKPGNIGTTDWHTAATLSFDNSQKEGGLLYFNFNSNIYWDELDAATYQQVQYYNLRRLYGLSDAFGAGIENGIFVALDNKSKCLGDYADDDIYVTFDNQGPNGTVRVRIGLNTSILGNLSDRDVTFTFTTLFMLPDGTPLREENAFRCSAVYTNPTHKAVTVTPAGEYFSESTGVASGDPLLAYKNYHIEYYIHAPWADLSRNSYTALETKPTAYGLSEDFYNRLFDSVFIGLDGNEISLRKAITTYKLSIYLEKDGEDRTVLGLKIKTADMNASGYPMDLTKQVLSIRFGNSYKSNGSVILDPFCLPGDIPVRFVCLARPVSDYTSYHWLTRHTLSSKINSSESSGKLYIDFSSNGPWYLSGSTYYNVLTDPQNMGFPIGFLNSLKNKLVLNIGGQEKTLAQWGLSNFDVLVFERNGRWAMQLQIKTSLISGKTLAIKFTEGFVGPDGTTLVIPVNYVRDGTNSWTGSTDPGLFFANRTVSILNQSDPLPSYSVSLKSGSYSGNAPYYIYGQVKLENAAAINPAKYAGASIVLDYASSADVTIATLDADTNGWVALTELYGGVISLKKENCKITVKMDNMSGKVSLANLIVADNKGNIIYSMSNDTTLYGVGDVRNVNNVNSASSWSTSKTGDVSFPIVTKGDSNYVPSRVLKMTINSGYDGGDASFLISQNAFTRGITYYITGRIRTNITSTNPGANAVLSGAGDNKYYGTQNGDWVAITNADGSTLNFTVEENAKTLTTPNRTISIGSHLNTEYARMVIQVDQFNARYTAGTYIVRGYYQVTNYSPNLNASGHKYIIGGNANSGTQEGTSDQTSWKYFKLTWDSTKGQNLDFELSRVNGFMRLANLTIEDLNGKIIYDMARDEALTPGWHTGFPWAPSIWYITRFGQKDDVVMDLLVDKVSSATPIQYTYERATTPTQKLTTTKRTLAIHTQYGTTNGKMTIQMDQFKTRIGSGTYTVRGYYQVTGFTAVDAGARYEIGDGASKGTQSGSANQTEWTYFELTWSPTTNLNFEFHGAYGYLRLANVTIEDSRYKVVYDMSTDANLDGTYHTTFPQYKGIWTITYFGQPTPKMDLSISASTTATPMQYKSTIGSVKRKIAMWAAGNTVNGKMQVYGSKFAAKHGAGTYTVSGYYYISDYKAIDSRANIIIGTGATSGTVNNYGNTNGWTYFSLQWNTNNNLLFEYWYATGYLAIGNVTFINSSGTIVYDTSNDTSLPTNYQESFPMEPNFWYWGYSGAKATLNMSIEAATTASPSRNADGHTEVATDTIADSAVKRSMSIHASEYRQNGKIVITTAQAQAKFGSNKTLIVRGYYKVTDYAAIGDNPWWQIGSNADSGHTGHKTGNQTSWKYFKIYWNTNKDLNFEFWNANGYLRLANLTIEDLNGGLRYDMSTDTALGGASTSYHTTFPQQKGIWYITHESSINFMDASVSAVTSATPKQYTVNSITETSKTLSTPNRTIGFGAKQKLRNGKMIITSAQATERFGANKDLIVRGYYKVVSYSKVGDNDFYSIGTNSPDAITGRASQNTWTYFKLRWNTSKDLNFEFWNANGFMYLANLTIETAQSDRLGDIVYDLCNDTALYKDGAYYEGLTSFPLNPSIWYFTTGGQVSMDASIGDVSASATPVQYEYNWDYLKFSMWQATGTMEIADLTIYHIYNGKKVIDYSMATDSLFNSNQTKVNADGTIASGSKWMSWEWKDGSTGKFTYYIVNNNNAAHPDSEYLVPTFKESVG